MIEIFIIVALLLFIGYREWRHESHIRDLEEKLMASTPTILYRPKGENNKKPESSPIMKGEENEMMMGDIPFMEIPKDFKIETEESPTTPLESRARAHR